MSFMFRPAIRENVGLLIGLIGPSGSGKTYSAMRLASGIAAAGGTKPFCVIDTEAGRAKHYADQFRFDHGDLKPPFRPATYEEGILAADAAGYPAIVVDSFSHEHAGDGGLLDWHEEELQRMGGRDSANMAAWIKPKMAHKSMVQKLLQVRAHLILCFRAEEKIEMVKNKETGKLEIRPKTNLAGFSGWIPVCEKNLPYELTVSLLLSPEKPGYPIPIKLQAQHRDLFPLDQPITEKSGEALAQWARGGDANQHLPGVSPGARVPVTGGGASGSTTPTGGRTYMIGKIKAAADRHAIPPHVRTTLAKQCIGNASMQDADIAALQDLLNAVEHWRPAK